MWGAKVMTEIEAGVKTAQKSVFYYLDYDGTLTGFVTNCLRCGTDESWTGIIKGA